jgi:hypothetical protein
MLNIVAKAAIIAAIAFAVAVIALATWKASFPAFSKLFDVIIWFVRLLDRHSGFLLAVFTGFLVLATILLFSASEKAAKSAKDSADLAKDALVATQRPWITVEAKIASGLSRNVNGFNVSVHYLMENVGNTPALYVHPDQKIFLGSGTFSLQNEMKIFSENVRINASRVPIDQRRHPGTFIFPNRKFEITVTSTGTQADIDAAAAGSPDQGFLIYIFSVVQYISPVDQKWHQTGAIYELTHNPKILSTPVYKPDMPDIAQADLSFQQSWAGAYAD